jgi:hypothetical protein
MNETEKVPQFDDRTLRVLIALASVADVCSRMLVECEEALRIRRAPRRQPAVEVPPCRDV